MNILVTGATGTIGSEVLRIFSRKGYAGIRALVHNPEKIDQVTAEGADAFVGSFEDRVSLDTAMSGITTVILITPANPSAEDQASNVIAAAKASGVKKIVRISAIKADPYGPTNNTQAHGRTEAELSKSGLRHVLLRPNLFMQNLFIAADQIKEDGQFSFAMGVGRMGMIDTRDIAACAVECALSDKWNGQTLELTGSDSINYAEVAAVISELSGKSVEYVPVSPNDMYAMIEGAGWGDWMAAMVQGYGQAYASGWGDFTTSNVEEITGKQPHSFREFTSELFLPAL